MNGIIRIHINSNWKEPRLETARLLEPSADALYRSIFNDLGHPLMPGTEIRNPKKEEVMASYDYQEGIDLILNFADGTKATLQEKYLFSNYRTATFTEHQKNKFGEWYTCTAQYYFVGYARNMRGNDYSFQEWILLDLLRIHLAEIDWKFGNNRMDGYLGIKFRYAHIDEIPKECIVAMGNS